VADGYTPLEAGVALLPVTLLMLALSSRSGQLAARIGPRLQMSVGPVIVGAGLGLLGRAASDSSYGSGVLPGVIVLGLGLAVTVAPLTATALGALPAHQAGLASAVNNDVARLGGLLAVAVLPAICGLSGDAYLQPHAVAAGFRTAVLLSGACCVAAGVLAAVGLREPAVRPSEAPRASCFHCALDAAPIVVHGEPTPSTT
jgi:hypothetical protein